MGGFLVNLFVRSEDQGTVIRATKEVLLPIYVEDAANLGSGLTAVLDRDAAGLFAQILAIGGRGTTGNPDATVCFVSPSIGGWVGVHDSLMQAQSEPMCEYVTRVMSEKLGSTAISFLIHDGDYLCYWLAREGRLIDTYHSWPEISDMEENEQRPDGGDSILLAEACGVPEAAAQIAEVLGDQDRLAHDQLETLGELLGITDADVHYDLFTHESTGGLAAPAYDPGVKFRDQYVAVKRRDLDLLRDTRSL